MDDLVFLAEVAADAADAADAGPGGRTPEQPVTASRTVAPPAPERGNVRTRNTGDQGGRPKRRRVMRKLCFRTPAFAVAAADAADAAAADDAAAAESDVVEYEDSNESFVPGTPSGDEKEEDAGVVRSEIPTPPQGVGEWLDKMRHVYDVPRDVPPVINSLGEEHKPKGDMYDITLDVPSFRYKGAADVEICVICNQSLASWQWVTRLPCAHLFHTSCIKTWATVKQVCPVDSSDVRRLVAKNESESIVFTQCVVDGPCICGKRGPGVHCLTSGACVAQYSDGTCLCNLQHAQEAS